MLVTLNAHTVTSGRITIPAWGLWFAELELDGEHDVSGQVTIKLVDLTMKGTVISGGKMNGRSSYRVVAGFGKWGKKLAKKSYTSDAGVRLRTVLTDAATDAGEQIEVDADRVLGSHWARPAGAVSDTVTASRVLELIAPSAWYVGEDGITRLGKRATTALETSVQRVSVVNKAIGTVTLAPEKFAQLVPGVVVEEIEAVDVHHIIRPEGIRTTIYGDQNKSASRQIAAWRKFMDQLDPRRPYRSLWEYRVVTQEGKRLNLQPVKVSAGMPDLRRVRVRPGVPGVDAQFALGSCVIVGFINEDPAYPAVLGCADAEGSGFVPLQLTLAEGVQGIARVGDSVVAGPYTGSIVSGSALVRCG